MKDAQKFSSKIESNILIDFKEIKDKTFKRENIYSLIIIIFIFIIDRYSKVQITNNFLDNTYYINDFLNFDLIWNTGIGFGLLSWDNSIFYNIITAIIGIVIVTLFYFLLNSKIFDRVSLSLIIGGALGNFYDRLSYKAVPDFIDVHYGSFHWFTFNCADIFITIGIICFLLGDLFKKNV